MAPAASFSQARQPAEKGIPYSNYFSPRQYKADPQNWAVLQKDNGVMVFGNGDGILTFDGARWQLTPLPNGNLVRTIALGSDERLYAGGYNEIGYLDDNGSSTPIFVSLLPHLKPEQREFGHVWNIIASGHGLWFSTDSGLFVWDGKTVRQIDIPFEDKRIFTAVYRHQILVQPGGEGLFHLHGDSLKDAPGGRFYKEKRITAIVPYDSAAALICTLDHGIFLYDGKESKPFHSEANTFLHENRLYKAIRLRNGNIAMGTLNKGVVIIDRNGSVVNAIAKGRGLGDNAVYNLAEDHQGALWVTMSVGISRVELQTPVTWFDIRNGLEGAVNDIARYNGTLYAGTMLGFFKLEPGASYSDPAYFKKIGDVPTSVWAMTERHSSLLLATDYGCMEQKNGRYTFLDDHSGAVMLASAYDPDVVFVGLADGVVILRFTNGRWRSSGRIDGVSADVGELNEDRDGNLWLGTFSEGVVRLRFPGSDKGREYLKPDVTHFGEDSGLPVGYVQMHRMDGELVFRIEPHDTLYVFDQQGSAFKKLSIRNRISGADDVIIYPFSNETSGKQWMMHRQTRQPGFDFLLCTSTPSGIQQRHIPFRRVQEDVDEVIHTEDGVAWLGGLDGIARFEYREGRAENNNKHNTIIGEIVTGDSVRFSGVRLPDHPLSFAYASNTLGFSYSSTSYDLMEENRYQHFLEGFDKGWSTWTTDRERSYTNLPEGTYTFRVRARNVYGEISPEATFAFTVAPPWYRHPVAYTIYGILITAFIYGIVRVRSFQLEKEKLALEEIIRERTTAISAQNLQLEQQAEELKTQTERLTEMDRMKSVFFTNISHEFRTPLSLIFAPLEKKLQEESDNTDLLTMHRNARKLQHLINQLLDLSRLESGEMRVYRRKGDLTVFTGSLLTAFDRLAESRGIRFRSIIPDRNLETGFDADKIETILSNLLSNAFKFTPEGGEITFEMNVSLNRDACTFVVADNGPGIAPEDVPRIFDRFYQADDGVKRAYEGSGIGLALSKELVLLLEGDISVRSELGKGTAFIVTLPLSDAEPDAVTGMISDELSPSQGISVLADVQPEKRNGEAETILLVEDNSDLRSYLSGILGKMYRVVTANNGQEALTIAQAEIPDLILSDMMMPVMDGFTLCTEIKKHELTCHIPFVLLTARSTVESRLEGLELGADDYMTKPFHVNELQVRVKNLLQQRKLLKERFGRELRIGPADISVSSLDEQFLNRITEAVETHLADPGFSVESLAQCAGMSRKNLHRKLVALTDQTPNEFIRIFRLKRAMQLLEQRAGNVKEVAFGVGFNNLSYFSKCFKEQFGFSPADVRIPQS